MWLLSQNLCRGNRLWLPSEGQNTGSAPMAGGITDGKICD